MPLKRVFSLHPGLGAAIVAVILIVAASGCLSKKSSPAASPPSPPATPVVAAEFVGNAVCAECHTTQHATHSKSHHANTLRRVDRKSLGALAPKAGALGKTDFVLFEQNGQYAVGMPKHSDGVAPLELALGSGKTGMTYVASVGPDIAEFRLSYFPSTGKWFVTPGQGPLADDDIGKMHRGPIARRCIQCHAVALPENSVVPDEKFFGVGCESCHGAGSVHATAMRAGKYDQGKMEDLHAWTPDQLNEMCGKCHGTAKDVAAGIFSKDATNRHMVYGLSLSRCFKESRGAMSCTTCHDPHADASKNDKTYEAICLTCHTNPVSPKRPAVLKAATLTVCPVNPKSDCITCHMPKRPAIPGTQLPTFMADHYIRTRPPRAQTVSLR